MSADLSWLLCSRSRTGRRLGLWDITKAETTLRNVPNAGRNMSASRARSSLRAMLRLARERRRANNAIATRASYARFRETLVLDRRIRAIENGAFGKSDEEG